MSAEDDELGGPAKVGAREIYDLVLATKSAVDAVAGGQLRHGDRLDEHDRELDDHETRIRAIELRRAFSPAQLASLLVALAGAAVAVIALFIGH